MIDLHLHTTASDGSLSLRELVLAAKAVGLNAIAITDHDSIKSAKKIKTLKPTSKTPEVVPGVELSVYDNRLNYLDLHVLGLFIDPENPALNTTLARLELDRQNQKKAIVKKLNKLGYQITYAEVKKKAKGTVGRPHIAQVLVENYPRQFPDVDAVFEKLLGHGKPAYVSRTDFFSLEESISVIHGAGGLAILCHPGFYEYDLEKLLGDFKRLGGDGVETVYHYETRNSEIQDTKKLAKVFHSYAVKFNFLESGGSDFHGPGKGAKLGALDVPDRFLGLMKARLMGVPLAKRC